jgi:hypothetical protein
MNFLAAHDCRIDFREFRNLDAEQQRFPRLVMPSVLPGPPKEGSSK